MNNKIPGILFFGAKQIERRYFQSPTFAGDRVDFCDTILSIDSVGLAKGYEAVSIFTSDDASEPVIKKLNEAGVKCIAIRASGFDNVDLEAAEQAGIVVTNVPGYSPYAVAEQAVALLLAVNRKINVADRQVHANNFTVDNLVGFDLYEKTIGIVGTGRIGSVMARIMNGFGCSIVGFDINSDLSLTSKYDVHYTDLNSLCTVADIISIHLPLNSETRHLFDESKFARMKKGVVLINTARGAIVQTGDLIKYLQSGHVGYYAADVYENERGIFFNDRSSTGIQDKNLKTLLSMKNVLITPHQGFATNEALKNIADTVYYNILSWANGTQSGNELTGDKSSKPKLQIGVSSRIF